MGNGRGHTQPDASVAHQTLSIFTLIGVTIDKRTVRKQPKYHCLKDLLQSAYNLKCQLCSCPTWFGFQTEYFNWQYY